jgi:hypothetical protein
MAIEINKQARRSTKRAKGIHIQNYYNMLSKMSCFDKNL